MAPFANIFNETAITFQFINCFLNACRILIILLEESKYKIFTLAQMYDVDITELKYWFAFEDLAITDIQDLREKFIMPGHARLEPISNNRKIYDTNQENEKFKNLYSNGTYTGFKSPQVNDFFTSEENFKSMFNNVSILKCVFQIANLVAVYNVDYPYYTLDN